MTQICDFQAEYSCIMGRSLVALQGNAHRTHAYFAYSSVMTTILHSTNPLTKVNSCFLALPWPCYSRVIRWYTCSRPLYPTFPIQFRAWALVWLVGLI